MLELVAVFLSFSLLCVLYYIVRKQPSRPPLSTVDLVAMLLFFYAYIPSVFLYLWDDWHYLYRFNFDAESVFWAANLSFVSLFLGYLFLAQAAVRARRGWIYASVAEWRKDVNVVKIYWVFIFLVLLSSMYWLALAWNDLREMVLASLLADDAFGSEVVEFRVNRSGMVGVLKILLPHLFVLCVTAAAYIFYDKPSKFRLAFFVFVSVWAVLFLVAMMFRGAVVFMVLNTALAIMVFKGYGGFRKMVSFLVVVLLSLILMLTYFRAGPATELDLLGDHGLIHMLLRRLITSMAQFGYVLKNFSPYGTEFGATYLNDFMALAPGPDYDFNGQLYIEMGYGHGGGTATITLLGELYANFGYVGLVVGSAIFGMLIRGLEVWMYRDRPSPLRALIYVVLSVLFAKIVLSGVGGVYVGMIVFVLFVVLLFVVKKMLSAICGRNVAFASL